VGFKLFSRSGDSANVDIAKEVASSWMVCGVVVNNRLSEERFDAPEDSLVSIAASFANNPG
jgi:hypothetical protein